PVACLETGWAVRGRGVGEDKKSALIPASGAHLRRQEVAIEIRIDLMMGCHFILLANWRA
ncbi:MAG: hypothetical protein ACHP9Z_31060, partial [Streptosporangiales bacterium]